ncbi:hypothetical protein, partial [Streptomyces sp. NPDC059753]|uniref:hypothetical protein n=1 Tax=Streptomyces sp. NPDC059753 TaxID=3346933 RepID=UPI003662CA84
VHIVARPEPGSVVAHPGAPAAATTTPRRPRGSAPCPSANSPPKLRPAPSHRMEMLYERLDHTAEATQRLRSALEARS